MIYAYNTYEISRNGGSDEPQAYETVQDAERGFRDYIKEHRPSDTIVYCYLFKTEEDALAAYTADEYEVDVDESKAFRTIDWERGFGFSWRT